MACVFLIWLSFNETICHMWTGQWFNGVNTSDIGILFTGQSLPSPSSITVVPGTLTTTVATAALAHARMTDHGQWSRRKPPWHISTHVCRAFSNICAHIHTPYALRTSHTSRRVDCPTLDTGVYISYIHYYIKNKQTDLQKYREFLMCDISAHTERKRQTLLRTWKRTVLFATEIDNTLIKINCQRKKRREQGIFHVYVILLFVSLLTYSQIFNFVNNSQNIVLSWSKQFFFKLSISF